MIFFLFLILFSSSLCMFASEIPHQSSHGKYKPARNDRFLLEKPYDRPSKKDYDKHSYGGSSSNNSYRQPVEVDALEKIMLASAGNTQGLINKAKEVIDKDESDGGEKKEKAAKVEEVLNPEQAEKKEKAKDNQQERLNNFIHDAYTTRRGEPKMLAIYCDECDAYVMDYQKDGPGRLLRCYLDRIHSPARLRDRQDERFSVRNSPNLKCPRCSLNIGYPMIYKSENRPAYDMAGDRFYFKHLPN